MKITYLVVFFIHAQHSFSVLTNLNECQNNSVFIFFFYVESQLLLAKQVALIEPLRDLAAHEPDTTFLSPEYRYSINLTQPFYLRNIGIAST